MRKKCCWCCAIALILASGVGGFFIGKYERDALVKKWLDTDGVKLERCMDKNINLMWENIELRREVDQLKIYLHDVHHCVSVCEEAFEAMGC